MSLQPLDETFADEIFTELASLEVGLDADPLVYGPKRLNGKIALSRKMTARCERVFLDVSQRLSQFKRSLRQATLILDLEMKNLLANDPEVRAGRAVSERNAIATGKLKDEVQAMHHATHAVEDLEAVLTVIKAKRADLRDIQGRLRDQIRLCQEEIGLGNRWGSKSPRGTELEPGQGFADGADVDEIDDLIQAVRSVSDAETHLEAEVDDTDTDEEQEADLASSAETEESESEEESEEPVVEPKVEPEPEPSQQTNPAIIAGDDLAEEFGFVPHCAVCGEKQSRSPSGMQCVNGHGGVESVPPGSNALDKDDQQPPAAEVLPGTADKMEVAAFLEVDEAEELSRREIEEADEDLDIDSILSNFSG